MPDCGGHTDVQIDGHVAQTANTAHMHLQAVNSNFCSRPKTHRLATIHSVQTTDGRNTVSIARPLVRSAKNEEFTTVF